MREEYRWISDFITIPELRKRWACDNQLLKIFYHAICPNGYTFEEFKDIKKDKHPRTLYGKQEIFEIHTIKFDSNNERFGFATIYNSLGYNGKLVDKHAFPISTVNAYERANPMLTLSHNPIISHKELLSIIHEKNEHIKSLEDRIENISRKSSVKTSKASKVKKESTEIKWTRCLEEGVRLALECSSNSLVCSYNDHLRLWKERFGSIPARKALRAMRKALPAHLKGRRL